MAIAYTSNDFHCLLDTQLYLPNEWCEHLAHQKNSIPDDIQFKTERQIALDLIDRSKTIGIRFKAWTFDEFYGRDGRLLAGLDCRAEAFVSAIPRNFQVWLSKPQLVTKPSRKWELLSIVVLWDYELCSDFFRQNTVSEGTSSDDECNLV